MPSVRAVTGEYQASRRQGGAPGCPRHVRWLARALLGLLAAGTPAQAQSPAPEAGSLSSMPWPAPLSETLAAIDDYVAADRSQFLLELIRRSHRTPIGASDPNDPVIRTLVSRLDAGTGATAPPAGGTTLPLPLPASVWIDAVFGGKATPETLAGAIVRSRSPALFYYALLSLDEPTRTWLAGQRDLVIDLSSKFAAPFVLASPAFRVSSEGRLLVPGGEPAEAAWEDLAGRPVDEPASFIRALLAGYEGRLAYFYGIVGQMTPLQQRIAIALDVRDPVRRVASVRRLHAVFERIAEGWVVDARVFWRPALDPALLLADLPVSETGRPLVLGTQSFWTAVFREGDSRLPPTAAAAAANAPPLEFAWLCERVFETLGDDQRKRYRQVQFGSRLLAATASSASTREEDVVEAVRAAGTFPALAAVLERANVTDPAVHVQASRRATQLSGIGDEARAVRALTQFQGLVALLTRAAARSAWSAAELADALTTLCAVETSNRGDYEGRLVEWLDARLRRDPAAPARTPTGAGSDGSAASVDDVLAVAGPLERRLLRWLAGTSDAAPRAVEWEGTRYRVDLTRAEAVRLTRLLGEYPRPYITSARALTTMATALSAPGITARRMQDHAEVLTRLARDLTWDEAEDWSGDVLNRQHGLAVGLKARRPADAPQLARVARELADDLMARGLLELTYAAALGQPDRAWVVAADAASRHEFGLRHGGVRRRFAPWRLPSAGGDTMRGWRVVGSLLALDVRLAEFSLMRLSAKPPARRPSLNEDQRRVFVESVSLVQPQALSDGDRDAIVSAMRRGRARLVALRSPHEATALAGEIGLSPARRALLPWVVAHDRSRLPAFLSPLELLWLGLDRAPVGSRFHGWGASAESRLGCLCLQITEPRPWEFLAGRWGTGIFASGFPDLNLRLAELLAELGMPAALLGPVLASATLDLINNSVSRDQDDRRGLVEFVQGLTPARVEQYLALLTSDGPLVPIGDVPEPSLEEGDPR